MSNTEKVRGEILEFLKEHSGDIAFGYYNEDCKKDFYPRLQGYSNAILALPDILVRTENQELPAMDARFRSEYWITPYQEAQQDMLKAGFVKVEKKK